jgi:hypothetical protein
MVSYYFGSKEHARIVNNVSSDWFKVAIGYTSNGKPRSIRKNK